MSAKKLVTDWLGLSKVVGARHAANWMMRVVANAHAVLRERNLQPADRAMGAGPFEVRVAPYVRSFRVSGPQVFSGIREMYVRDVYLRHGLLTIDPGDVVVDLGANMGNFTALALAAHPDTRVVAVEPSRALNEAFVASVGLNPGFLDRVQLIRAFVGVSGKANSLIEAQADDYRDATWLSPEELVQIVGPRIDFLKCDIEGGEFDLLRANGGILKITRKMACEVHAFAGDVRRFIEKVVRVSGFELLHVKYDPDGTATFLARRERL